MLAATQLGRLRDVRRHITALSSAIEQLHRCTDSTAVRAASVRLEIPARAPSSGLHGSSTGGRGSLLPWSIAGGLAAALVWADTSLCEQQGGGGGHRTQQDIEMAAMALWSQLDETVHRLEASSHGPGTPLPRGRAKFTFTLPQSLDIQAAATEAARRLRESRFSSMEGAMAGAAVTDTRNCGPDGCARRLRRTSRSLGELVVDVFQPNDPGEPATIAFEGATEEPAAAENLRLMSAVLAAAARPRRPSLGRLFGLQGEEEGQGDGMPLLGDLDPFFGSLREMRELLLNSLERVETESGWGDDDLHDTRPPPLRHPKRVEGESDAQHGSGSGSGPLDTPEVQASLRKLRSMGAQVFLPQEQPPASAQGQQQQQQQEAYGQARDPLHVDWGNIAGYEDQKRAIEDCLLLPLVRPDVYDGVARGTRLQYSSNRPRAVLFTGPPGTGKTSSARVIAAQAAVPLVYLPLEALVSKWYGESERHLAEALAAADAMPGGCIVFLDELDALATSRGDEGMHEVTRRLLGVLLRHMDGFDSSKKSCIVGATNRPQDLDAALLSRFAATVDFGLPGESARGQILRQYAHQLGEAELAALAKATPGLSGRDLRDVCEQAERRWAAKIIRGQAQEGELPPLNEYLMAAAERVQEMGVLASRHASL